MPTVPKEITATEDTALQYLNAKFTNKVVMNWSSGGHSRCSKQTCAISPVKAELSNSGTSHTESLN